MRHFNQPWHKKPYQRYRPQLAGQHFISGFVLAGFLICVLVQPAAASGPPWELDDGYYTIVSDMGRELLLTGHIVSVGDQFIDEDNRKYEVYRVADRRAYARFVSRIDLSAGAEHHFKWRDEAAVASLPFAMTAQQDVDVGIYHTHSAESYIPSSGTDSVDGGGEILEVGEQLSSQLQQQGVRAKHDSAIHCPHDAHAYIRSRRTALSLAEKNPQVLFDVHRDSAPREPYTMEIQGEDVARILLVVGQQNPNREANTSFAKALKEAADEEFPGLVKGILMGQGDYNQDIGPRMLLLEVGSQEVSVEEAGRGAAHFAAVVPGVLPEGGEGGAYRSVWWLVIGLLVAGAAFLYISTGSWREAWARLGQYLPERLGRPR